jgi:hypothetical protein
MEKTMPLMQSIWGCVPVTQDMQLGQHAQATVSCFGRMYDNNTGNHANDVKQGNSRVDVTYVRGVVVTAATVWLQLTRVLLKAQQSSSRWWSPYMP